MTNQAGKDKAAPLEWLAAAIGLTIFIALFAVILRQEIGQGRAAAPDLAIEDVRVTPTPGGSLVQFTVHNRSDQTAAAVSVEGKPAGAASPPSTVTIDYVPAKSRVSAGLIFAGDMKGRPVEIRPVGYRRP